MKTRNLGLLFLAVMLISGTLHANMKKGQVPSGATKYFAFTNNFDGPCTASLIFDSATADLDTGFLFHGTDDVILCFSASTQKNFDSCTVGLPPNNYQVFVSSYKGPSAFRLVVNCGGQQTVGAAGQRVVETELREVEPSAETKKLQQKLNRIATAMKQ